MATHPLLAWTIATYILGALVGAFLFEPVLLLWPHLFLLAAQVPFGAPGDLHVWVTLGAGLVPVSAVAWFLERKRPSVSRHPATEWLWALAVIITTLAGITLLAFLAAFLFGWPAGV